MQVRFRNRENNVRNHKRTESKDVLVETLADLRVVAEAETDKVSVRCRLLAYVTMVLFGLPFHPFGLRR